MERWAAQRPVIGECGDAAPSCRREGVAALVPGWNHGNDKERLAIARRLS